MNSFQYSHKFVKSLLLITAVLLPSLSWAGKLNIIVGFERPPYVLQETNSGYELELLSQVVKLMGYDVNYIYVPYGRTQKMLSEPDIDAITTMTAGTESQTERLTDTYVTYHNSVISLAEAELDISKLSDLQGIGVISFHNATSLLGKEYRDAVANNPDYMEIAKQKSQVTLFLNERVHCIVIDKNIFNYLIKQLNIDRPVVFHNLFPPTEYKMVFKDPKLVASFNKNLAIFKTSPHYQQLQQKYLSAPL